MSKGRIVIIAYYFPPMGGSGSRRMVAFSKLLPKYGWDVDIITPKPLPYYYPGQDDVHRINSPIHRTFSLEPNRIGSIIAPNARLGVRKKLGHIWDWLPPPDDKIGWIPFVRHKLAELSRNEKIDYILTSGPPHSVHLAGLGFSDKSKWIMDMRDEWSDFPLKTYPTTFHRLWDSTLEKMCVKQAELILEVNAIAAQRCKSHWDDLVKDKVVILPNGFDHDEMVEVEPVDLDSNYMNIVYTGTLQGKRSLKIIIESLSALINLQHLRIRMFLIGARPQDEDRLLAEHLPRANFILVPPQERLVALSYVKAADLLWLPVGNWPGAEGILPGKTFEYLAARKPILLTAPEGATTNILNQFNRIYKAHPDDTDGITTAISNAYNDWRSHLVLLRCDCELDLLEAFTWQARVKQLNELLEQKLS